MCIYIYIYICITTYYMKSYCITMASMLQIVKNTARRLTKRHHVELWDGTGPIARAHGTRMQLKCREC